MQDNQFPWLCIQTLFLGSFWVYPVGLFPCHFTLPHKKFDCMKFGIKKKKEWKKHSNSNVRLNRMSCSKGSYKSNINAKYQVKADSVMEPFCNTQNDILM